MLSLKLRICLLLCLVLTVANSQEPASADKFISVPPGIVTNGIPQLPASLLDDIKPYIESRVAYLQDWHPLRQEMLILTRLGNTMQSHTVSMPGGMRRQVTFYEEPTYQSLFDPQKGAFIIVSKDIRGNEYYQVYRQDLTTGKTILLSDGGTSYNFNLMWDRKGEQLLYTSFQKNAGHRDIHMVDPRNPASNRVLISLEGFSWGIHGISKDSRKILLSGEDKIWLYDTITKTKTPLLPLGNDKDHFSALGFSADDAGFYLLTDKGSEFNQLAFYDFKTSHLSLLTQFTWEVYNAYPSPDGKHVAFIVNEAGAAKCYVLNTATRQYKPIAGLPTGVLYGMRWSKDSELLGFHLSTANANSDIYTWNTKTGAVVLWLHNELGGIDANAIAPPRLIQWKSFDGLQISGFLYPAGRQFTGKRPVIIDIHGGPVMQSRPLFNGNDNYYTNELGVVVIHPNIRGSSGYGKTFTELDNGLKKEDAVKDIGALLDWIAAQPDLDASRVMVTGGSYGGYMTYRTAIAYHARVRCAVAAFGGTNVLTHRNNVDSAYRAATWAEFGDDRDSVMYDYFTRTAPVNNAALIKMPILIVQGKNDPRVPYTESEQMVRAIKQNGGKVWYLIANDEGHGFMQKPNEDYLFYVSVTFVKKYLLQ